MELRTTELLIDYLLREIKTESDDQKLQIYNSLLPKLLIVIDIEVSNYVSGNV